MKTNTIFALILIKQIKIMSNVATKTPFKLAVEKVMNGELQAPRVDANGVRIPYFRYQLSTHHFHIKLMAKGLTFKQIKFTDLKRYYGLKGRSAKECLPQFEEIMNNYFKEQVKLN